MPHDTLSVGYRPRRACAELGISRSTLYRFARAGKLDIVRIGERTSIVTGDSIRRLIERSQQERAA